MLYWIWVNRKEDRIAVPCTDTAMNVFDILDFPVNYSKDGKHGVKIVGVMTDKDLSEHCNWELVYKSSLVKDEQEDCGDPLMFKSPKDAWEYYDENPTT